MDLYTPELNFVFGEASSAGQVAVFSLARLYSMTVVSVFWEAAYDFVLF